MRINRKKNKFQRRKRPEIKRKPDFLEVYEFIKNKKGVIISVKRKIIKL